MTLREVNNEMRVMVAEVKKERERFVCSVILIQTWGGALC